MYETGLKCLQFTGPHSGKTNDCGDGIIMRLLRSLAGAAAPEALGFWLADNGKVMQTWQEKVRKRGDARRGKKG